MNNGFLKYPPVLNLKKRVSIKSLVVFTKRLSTLIAAGLPLVKALRTLCDQLESCALKDIIKNVTGEVESGTNFSESLSHFPKVFPGFYVNMIKAGELEERLEGILKRLSEFLDKNQKFRERIKSALIYPAFVLLVAVLIMIMLMIFVMPTFTDMFLELGSVFPLPTKILIATSEIFRTIWHLILFIPVGAILLYKFIIRNPDRKFIVDRIKLSIPVVGGLLQQVSVARFARTLGTLLSSGVPILDALRTVKDIMGNEFIARAVLQVRDSIEEGESISGPMEASKAFLPRLL